MALKSVLLLPVRLLLGLKLALGLRPGLRLRLDRGFEAGGSCKTPERVCQFDFDSSQAGQFSWCTARRANMKCIQFLWISSMFSCMEESFKTNLNWVYKCAANIKNYISIPTQIKQIYYYYFSHCNDGTLGAAFPQFHFGPSCRWSPTCVHLCLRFSNFLFLVLVGYTNIQRNDTRCMRWGPWCDTPDQNSKPRTQDRTRGSSMDRCE